jgi:prevent-host-death family protein
VPTNRSAYEFARGDRTGVLITCVPLPAKTVPGMMLNNGDVVSVPHALLALLSEEPKYGLQLREEFEAGTGEVWPLNVGQVYKTLGAIHRASRTNTRYSIRTAKSRDPASRDDWTKLSLVIIMVRMTVSVNIHEAKTHLSRLLEQVAAGERVVISKAGTPIADLVPHQAATVTFGGLKGEIAYDDQAFDIDPDIQQMFYHTEHSQPGEAGRPGGDAAS